MNEIIHTGYGYDLRRTPDGLNFEVLDEMHQPTAPKETEMNSTSTRQPITGPYMLHVYPSGPAGKDREYISLPIVMTETMAREAFIAKCHELLERYPRRTNMTVNLMGVGHNVRVMGRIRETAATPVCQWSQRVNTNFSYPTGPTHYLDCAAADVRRAVGGPTFDASDYRPLSA